MKSVLKKLVYKGQSPVLLIDAPDEFKEVAAAFEGAVHTEAAGQYSFALLFVRSMAEAKKRGKSIARSLSADAVFWMAYPKGPSSKYPKPDINRDTGNTLMGEFGFQGVSLVAIDEDWSAMRFKRIQA